MTKRHTEAVRHSSARWGWTWPRCGVCGRRYDQGFVDGGTGAHGECQACETWGRRNGDLPSYVDIMATVYATVRSPRWRDPDPLSADWYHCPHGVILGAVCEVCG
jgi:hypothetical protein